MIVVKQAERDPNDLTAALVIMDFLSGRLTGGHQESYLEALETVLAEHDAVTLVPYRDAARLRTTGLAAKVPRGRVSRMAKEIRLCKRFLDAPRATLIIFPNADLRDFLAFAIAALLRKRTGRGMGVFVMRRDGLGMTGSARLGGILDRTVRWLCGHAPFFMVSDARPAMDHWRDTTGMDGPIVSIPVRRLQTPVGRGGEGSLVLGLLGSFRIEKGAERYDDLIALTLKIHPCLRVECQVSLSGTPKERALGEAIIAKWSSHPRVVLHTGYLGTEEFTQLLYRVDIVALPYDADSYGTGTSGVMFEAVAAKRVVLITPIQWGCSEYAGHPDVVWLSDTQTHSLEVGLRSALARVETNRQGGADIAPAEDRFRETWIAALLQAQEAIDGNGAKCAPGNACRGSRMPPDGENTAPDC